MPTSLNRIQVLMSPDVHAKVRSLAKYNRRSLSNICNELIIYALKQDKFREILADAEEEGVKMKPVDDPRTRINQPMNWDIDNTKEKEEEPEVSFTEAQMNQLAKYFLSKAAGMEAEKEESMEETLNRMGAQVETVTKNKRKAKT